MSNCDLCGREVMDYYEAIIEGSLLNVCSNCSKFGNIVNVKKLNKVKDEKKTKISSDLKKKAKELFTESIVEDYNFRIKHARENKGLKQEELSRAINVKESVIHSIESKKLEPSINIAKKLENFLNIILIENIKDKEKTKEKVDFKNTELTIGDLLKLSK